MKHSIPRQPVRFLIALVFSVGLTASAQNRWAIQDDGSIAWTVRSGEAHQDHVEMSGEQCSVILTYGVDTNAVFTIKRHVIFPMLRFFPNATRDHLALEFGEDASPRVFIDRIPPRNVVTLTTRVQQKGIVRAEGFMGRNREIAWTRSVFPSTTKPLVIENMVLSNRSSQTLTLSVEQNEREVTTNPSRGVYGGYKAWSYVVRGGAERVLAPGETMYYSVVVTAARAPTAPSTDLLEGGKVRVIHPGPLDEERGREARVNEFLSKLQLETPDRVLNTAFAFAKIRATESIYRTKGGLMHGPGGGPYYAAIWANDQAEYANPFFAFLGDAIAIESAVNSYRHFARFMNPEYRPIPSAINAEGDGTWHGARDRGDGAMIAYGASRFALALGRKDTAEELWPLIEWCLEYSRRQIDSRGVVASDSDELENRFPAGNANLCSSTLHYDALRSAVMLGRELGKPGTQLDAYAQQATALRAAIETHFGARVEGFDTYRYYDKTDLINHRVERHRPYATRDDVLRAWICMPLTVGIYDRAEGTIQALFSPRLWTEDGLATEAGQITFWDRSTLYALRGVIASGATQKGLDYLTYYSNRRLLGDHVPYPVEAYPEGNQRHLSAESALYCRVYTEGLFGMRPTGLRSFDCTPRLPKDWPGMALRKVEAFGNRFDLVITRDQAKLKLEVLRDGRPPIAMTIDEGATASVSF